MSLIPCFFNSIYFILDLEKIQLGSYMKANLKEFI